MVSEEAFDYIRDQNWHSNERAMSLNALFAELERPNSLFEGMRMTNPERYDTVEIAAGDAAIRDEDGLLLWFTTRIEIAGRFYSTDYSLGWDHTTLRKIKDFLEPERTAYQTYKVASYIEALNWRRMAQYLATKVIMYAVLPNNSGLKDVGYYHNGELRIKGVLRIADR